MAFSSNPAIGCRRPTARACCAMAEHHANSEIVGALPEGEWITRAPSLRHINSP